MQKKSSTISFIDLPDTITPLDYAKWRGIGVTKARQLFNRADFPRLKGTGVKQVADKWAVWIYDINMSAEDREKLFRNLIKENMGGKERND